MTTAGETLDAVLSQVEAHGVACPRRELVLFARAMALSAKDKDPGTSERARLVQEHLSMLSGILCSVFQMYMAKMDALCTLAARAERWRQAAEMSRAGRHAATEQAFLNKICVLLELDVQDKGNMYETMERQMQSILKELDNIGKD